MAALLVGMAVSAVLMTVAMPVWKQTATREKEAELVFRGLQYTRAIGLFQRRNGPGILPPSTQVLVDQRFLRKKFIDPISGGAFLVLPGAAPAQGATTQINTANAGRSNAPQTAGRSQTSGTGRGSGSNQGTAAIGAMEEPKDGNVPGGVAGVVSKSPDESLLVYNGQTHYNEWQFRFIPPPQPAQTAGDGRGGPGGGPGGPGAPAGRGGPTGAGDRGRGPVPPGGRGGFTITPPDGRAQPLPPGTAMPNPSRGSAPPGAPQPQRGR
jgi:type II secretory pathway pseudopilin PulG